MIFHDVAVRPGPGAASCVVSGSETGKGVDETGAELAHPVQQKATRNATLGE